MKSGFAFKSHDWAESGVPVVKIANVKEGRLVMDGCSFVPERIAQSASEFALRVGDILIAMTGYVGDVAIVHESDVPAMLNQRVGRFSIRDERRLDRRFLFYLLRSPDIRTEIEGLGYGSAQPNISPALIGTVQVPLPPLDEQHAIVQVLSALDEKIELNRRMNETLEAIARSIFKSWFVDFDPVRAKMEGRHPVVRQHIAEMFPDSLEGSELAEIPVGWGVREVGDVVTVVGGATPDTKNTEYWDSEHFFVTPKDLSGLQTRVLLKAERTISDEGLNRISSGLLPVGTVLLSSRAPIGYVAIADVPIAVNQGFIGMVCDGSLPSLYVMHWAVHNVEAFKQSAGGTTFAEINKRTFRPMPILVPPPRILAEFTRILKPIYDRITVALRESDTLASIRDALLPKLLSGEIRVKAHEELVGL